MPVMLSPQLKQDLEQVFNDYAVDGYAACFRNGFPEDASELQDQVNLAQSIFLSLSHARRVADELGLNLPYFSRYYPLLEQELTEAQRLLDSEDEDEDTEIDEKPHHPQCPAIDGFFCHCDDLYDKEEET